MERESVILEICRLIVREDEEVLSEIRECVGNTEAYVEAHLEEYERRCMSLENDSAEELQWLGMVNCLLRSGYAGEIDRNMTICDFGWELKSLRGYKTYNLILEDKFTNEDYGIDAYGGYDLNEDDEACDYEDGAFEDDDSVEGWCKYLNNKWADEGVCLAMIDIDTESYIVFLTEEDVLERLEELAESIDRQIGIMY